MRYMIVAFVCRNCGASGPSLDYSEVSLLAWRLLLETNPMLLLTVILRV